MLHSTQHSFTYWFASSPFGKRPATVPRTVLPEHWTSQICLDPPFMQKISLWSYTYTRETRGVAPADCFETEANGDSKSTNEGGPSLVGLLGLSCRYRRFLSSLGYSRRPRTKYFSPPYTISVHLSPSPSRQGRQLCWVSCLLACVSEGDSESVSGHWTLFSMYCLFYGTSGIIYTSLVLSNVTTWC